MKALSAILLALVLVSAGCVGQTQQPAQVHEQGQVQAPINGETGREVSFMTADKWTIKADYYPNKGKPVVVLLHMLGVDKSSWGQFPSDLAKDYAVLALDMRGHGSSTTWNGTQRTWESFSDDDWNSVPFDISAAKRYLENRGEDTDRLAVIGASIGANIALRYASITDKSTDAVAMISPGLNYRGVTTIDAIDDFDGKILLVTAQDDAPSVGAVSQLEIKSEPEQTEVVVYPSGGHGTELLRATLLGDRLLAWLQKSL